jgi:hypothetical protein
VTQTDIDVDQLIGMYRQAALLTLDEDSAEADRQAYQVHTYFKQLRETEQGRAGISGLMADPAPQVRRWAAVHSLMWRREEAREVLREVGPLKEADHR